jgi:sugar lactone lactonase YvrE
LLAGFAGLLFLWLGIAQVNKPQHILRDGDNGPATKAEVNDPHALAVDGSILYIAENTNTVRRLDLRTGVITTLQTQSKLEPIASLAVDTAGNLIVAEFTAERVRRVDPRAGTVTTVAGSGGTGFSGDGGPAINATLRRPEGVTTDRDGNIYFADIANYRIRRVDARTGTITTVAGNGNNNSDGDRGSALKAGLELPNSVAVDHDGNIFVAQYGYGQHSHRIRRIDGRTGIITTVAGMGRAGLSGDRGPAFSAGLQSPSDLLFDRTGNLYVVDPVNDRVRLIDANTKTIITVAGSTKGFGGDGGPASRARLNNPSSIALDADGNLYIAEFVNHRVRRVDARTGIIETIAGNGLPSHGHTMR